MCLMVCLLVEPSKQDQDFEVIAEKKSCPGHRNKYSAELSLDNCARSCQGSSNVFYFPRPLDKDRFKDVYHHCKVVRGNCPCYCVVGSTSLRKCNSEATDPRYNIYRFKPEYTEWSAWSLCKKNCPAGIFESLCKNRCGTGERYRTRTCKKGGYACSADKANFGQVQSCVYKPKNCLPGSGGHTGTILTSKLNCRKVQREVCRLYHFPGFSANVCWTVEKRVCS